MSMDEKAWKSWSVKVDRRLLWLERLLMQRGPELPDDKNVLLDLCGQTLSMALEGILEATNQLRRDMGSASAEEALPRASGVRSRARVPAVRGRSW